MKTFLYHENGWRMFQAEELPVKPNQWDYEAGGDYPYQAPYVNPNYYDVLEQYESEIAALKAKSIPVGNPEIFDLMEYGTRKREWIKGYHITGKIYEWPGDVEIKFVTENNISIARGRAYREESSSELKQGKKVAILTLPKEPLQ